MWICLFTILHVFRSNRHSCRPSWAHENRTCLPLNVHSLLRIASVGATRSRPLSLFSWPILAATMEWSIFFIINGLRFCARLRADWSASFLTIFTNWIRKPWKCFHVSTQRLPLQSISLYISITVITGWMRIYSNIILVLHHQMSFFICNLGLFAILQQKKKEVVGGIGWEGEDEKDTFDKKIEQILSSSWRASRRGNPLSSASTSTSGHLFQSCLPIESVWVCANKFAFCTSYILVGTLSK